MSLAMRRPVARIAAAVLAAAARLPAQDPPCEAAVGFSLDRRQSPIPFAGILGGEGAAGELTVEVPAGAPGRVEVFTNIVTGFAEPPLDGVQAWSLVIALEGEGNIAETVAEPEVGDPLLARPQALRLEEDPEDRLRHPRGDRRGHPARGGLYDCAGAPHSEVLDPQRHGERGVIAVAVPSLRYCHGLPTTGTFSQRRGHSGP